MIFIIRILQREGEGEGEGGERGRERHTEGRTMMATSTFSYFLLEKRERTTTTTIFFLPEARTRGALRVSRPLLSEEAWALEEARGPLRPCP